LKQVNKDGQLHVVPASIKGLYIIRFTVTSYYTTEEDIKRDWKIIQDTAHRILVERQEKVNFGRFQSSLVLSNVPRAPKFVNSSFVAFLQDPDLIHHIAKELKTQSHAHSQIPYSRRSIGALFNTAQKQMSFENAGDNGLAGLGADNRFHRLRQQASLDSKIDNIIQRAEKIHRFQAANETVEIDEIESENEDENQNDADENENVNGVNGTEGDGVDGEDLTVKDLYLEKETQAIAIAIATLPAKVSERKTCFE